MLIKSYHRAAFIALIACLIAARSFADNITFTMTNIMTGLPDTNAIILQPLLPEVGASGQYYTAGLPILLNPTTNGFVVYSNAYAGFYNANNQFISRNWTGAGQPGTFSGVSFVVLSNGVSVTYPFTQYPLSGSGGGVNMFNLYSGILAVHGINGIAASTIAGVVTIDGAGFTATITYAALTNGLSYIPANTNFVITEIVNTNNLGATGGNRYYNNTNYDAFGIGLLSFQSASNMTLTVLGASNTIYEAQITSTSNGVTTAFQNALGATNTTIQGQITSTTNGLATLIINATNGLGLASGLSAFVSTNRFDTANAALNATNGIGLNSGVSAFAPTNRFLQAATTVNDGSSISNLVTAPASGLTNFVAELANGKFTPFPLTSLPSGGTGGGATSVVETNAGPSAIGGSILYSRTNFDQPPGIALTIGQNGTNNVNASNVVYEAQITGTSNGAVTVATTFFQTGSNFSLTIGQNGTNNLNASNTIYEAQLAAASNSILPTVQASGTGTTNYVNGVASGITNNNLFLNTVTNGQGSVNFGTINHANWMLYTNSTGYFVSNTATAQTFFILSIASGNNAEWGSLNNNLFTSNGIFSGVLTEALGATLPGQVFISNLTNATGASLYLVGNTWQMIGGGLNIGTMPFTANLSTSTNLGGTGATIQGGQQGMFSGGGNGGANALTNLIFALASTNNNIGFVMTNGIASNTLATVTNIIQLTNNAIYTAIGASNAIYEPQITATSNGVTALTYPLANTNSPSIWNITHYGTLYVSGHPYQAVWTSSLGVTNFSGNLVAANGTYRQAAGSTTLWWNTNNFTYDILTNGAACLIQSNGVTVATAGNNLVGAYTITSPGSGNNPGVKLGSVIDETSVIHIGPANFDNLNAASENVANTTNSSMSSSNATFTGTVTFEGNVNLPSNVTNAPIGDTLFVDSVNGNNATGTRGNMLLPFLTISNAVPASKSNDLMFVQNGSYVDWGEGKSNNVNWYLAPGTFILLTNANPSFTGPILDGGFISSVSPIKVNVQGGADFLVSLPALLTTPKSDEIGVMTIETNSSVTFACNSIRCTNLDGVQLIEGDGINISGMGGSVTTPSVSPSYSCINVNYIEMDDYGGTFGDGGGQGPAAINYVTGTAVVNVGSIVCTNINGLQFGPSTGIGSSSSGNDSISVFNISSIYSHGNAAAVIWYGGTSTNQQEFINCPSIQADTDAAIFNFTGGGDKEYFQSSKIANHSTTTPVIKYASPTSQSILNQAWITAQKVQDGLGAGFYQYGYGSLAFTNIGNGNMIFNVLQWKEETNTYVKGFQIDGGTHTFNGGTMVLPNGIGMVQTGGAVTMNGLTIDTSANPGISNECISISGASSQLTLNNCTLNSGSAYAITNASGLTLTITLNNCRLLGGTTIGPNIIINNATTNYFGALNLSGSEMVASNVISGYGFIVHSNAWNLPAQTNGMINWDVKYSQSNGIPLYIYDSNGVAFVNFFGTGGGIIP